MNANPINRQQRDDLAKVIRRYLNGEVTAFEFDDLLEDYRFSSDKVVHFVAFDVWLFYDDLKDHHVNLEKPGWDYFQRLLLLLESDHNMQTTTRWRWSWSQPLALISLLGFIGFVFSTGWGWHLLLAGIPLGIISVLLAWLQRVTNKVGPYDPVLFPFMTFSDLKSTYDAVAFKKKRYPGQLHKRRIRSSFMNAILFVPLYITWCMLSPIVLAFQTLPQKKSQIYVVTD